MLKHTSPTSTRLSQMNGPDPCLPAMASLAKCYRCLIQTHLHLVFKFSISASFRLFPTTSDWRISLTVILPLPTLNSWLTKPLIMQILGSNSSNSASRDQERSSAIARTRARSDIIATRSWMATFHSLYSRPAARLGNASTGRACSLWSPGSIRRDGHAATVWTPHVTA